MNQTEQLLPSTERRCAAQTRSREQIENRQYYLCTNLLWLENKDEWPGLKAVAMAREERTINGKTSTDIRFF
ncbi:MAG: hypothetical protein SO161_08265 [Treponema sp.]|nr:hypothetical protein [Treponema sp.]MDY4832511.1 hypothetical protein [Treponema sp.]